MIRLVVTDLDGTFWGSDLVVPATHRDAVDELAGRGVEVIVATSRRRRVTAEHLSRCGMTPAAVVLDGAMGVDLHDGHRFHDAAFEVGVAEIVLGLFRRQDLEPCIYVDDTDDAEDAVDVVLAAKPSTSRVHIERLGSIARVGDLDAVVAAPGVYGFSVTGRDITELDPLASDLATLGAEYHLLFEQQYGGWSLFVAPPSVTKWSGVLAHCERRGIVPDEVLAVGDGDNDVDMLTRAAVGVAVRGGSDAALAAADCLIDGPDVGGWSEVAELAARSVR